MSETWGELPKSQIDPSTVDQEIDTKIQTHLDDPDAHIEAGQSLQSHKASEIIDHLARSIVRDKLAHDRFQIETYFESLDGFTISDNVFLVSMCNMEIDTEYVDGDVQYCYIPAADANENGGSPANNPFWQTIVKFFQTTNQLAYICSGDPDIPFCWGFKIVDNNLYAVWYDNDLNEYTEAIAGVNLLAWNVYKVIFTSATSIEFYVNDVLVHTATTNLPTDSASSFMQYYIKNTALASNSMAVQLLIYDEDFF